MKIKIDAVQMPQSPLHEKGKTYCYPLVVGQQTKTTDDMVDHIQEVCTLTRVDCNAVVEAMSAYITHSLAEGNLVHIDGLGTFTPALTFADPSKKSILQTPGDVKLSAVNFRPEAHLLAHLRETMKFDRKEGVRSSSIDIGTIVLELQKYYAGHKVLTTRQFESMFGLKRTRANTLLHALIKQEKLLCNRLGTSNVYHAGPTLFQPQKG